MIMITKGKGNRGAASAPAFKKGHGNIAASLSPAARIAPSARLCRGYNNWDKEWRGGFSRKALTLNTEH